MPFYPFEREEEWEEQLIDSYNYPDNEYALFYLLGLFLWASYIFILGVISMFLGLLSTSSRTPKQTEASEAAWKRQKKLLNLNQVGAHPWSMTRAATSSPANTRIAPRRKSLAPSPLQLLGMTFYRCSCRAVRP